MSDILTGDAVVNISAEIAPLKRGLMSALGLTKNFAQSAQTNIKISAGLGGLKSDVGQARGILGKFASGAQASVGKLALGAKVAVSMPLGGLRAGLARANGIVSQWGAKVALGIGAGLAGVATAGLGLVKLASDANEANTKLDAVWKDQADSVRNWADEYAKHIGRSKQEVRSMTTDQGAFFNSMGFGSADAKKLSESMVSLAYDMGSFHNLSDDDAMQKIMAGISGEAEPLKRLGIMVNETTVKQELMNMGFKNGTEGVSEQAKALARVNVIMRQTKDMQGDAFNTSEGVANSWKALTGQAKDLAVDLGTSLLPIAKALIDVLKGIVASCQNTVDGMGQVGATSGIIATLVDWIHTAGDVFQNWGLIAKGVGIELYEMWGTVVNGATWAWDNIKAFGSWIGDQLGTFFINAFSLVGTAFTNLATNIKNGFIALWKYITSMGKESGKIDWTPLLEGFQKQATLAYPKIKEFQSFVAKDERKELQKEWDKAFADKAKREKDAKAKTDEIGKEARQGVVGIDAHQFEGGKPTKEKKVKEEKENKPSFSSLADVWKSAQERMNGNSKDKLLQKQLKEQEATRIATQEQAKTMKQFVEMAPLPG